MDTILLLSLISGILLSKQSKPVTLGILVLENKNFPQALKAQIFKPNIYHGISYNLEVSLFFCYNALNIIMGERKGFVYYPEMPFLSTEKGLTGMILAESKPSYRRWGATSKFSIENHARCCFASGVELLYAIYGQLPNQGGQEIQLSPQDSPPPREVSILVGKPTGNYLHDICLDELDTNLIKIKNQMEPSQIELNWKQASVFLKKNGLKHSISIPDAIKKLNILSGNDEQKKILLALFAVRLMNQVITSIANTFPANLDKDLYLWECAMPDYGAVIAKLSPDALQRIGGNTEGMGGIEITSI